MTGARHRSRRATGVVLALAFGLAPPAASSAVLPIVGALTTVEGTGPGRIIVRVPWPARVWVFGAGSAILEGKIAAVAFVPGLEGPGEPTLIAAQVPQTTICQPVTGEGCRDFPPLLVAGKYWDPSDATYELPAGDYRLYLVSDGSPVSVTLHFRGLDGEVTLAPSDPVGLQLAQMDPEPRLPATELAHIAAASRDLGAAPGFLYALFWEVHDLGGPRAMWLCRFDGHVPSHGSLPACPGGRETSRVVGTGVANGATATFLLEGPLLGRQGVGFWRASGTLVRDSGGIAAWIGY